MTKDHLKFGVIYALLAYSMWGLLPIYWKQLVEISPLLILAYRIATFFVLIVIACFLFKSWPDIRAVLSDRYKLGWTMVSALAITFNWGSYILAVTSGHVLQSSLAYYLNPALIVLTGIFFFKETVLPAQTAAIVMAGAGIMVLLVGAGEFPHLALIMAVTFTLYGLSKRQAKLKTIAALFWETALTAPLAIAYIIYAEHSGMSGLLNASYPMVSLLLLASGIVTGLPLLLYTLGNDRIPFVWMGFCQFIAPTLMFLEAWLLYHEPLTLVRLLAYLCIWCSVGLFLWSIYQISRKLNSKLSETTDV